MNPLPIIMTVVAINLGIYLSFLLWALQNPARVTASCDVEVLATACGTGPIGKAVALLANAGSQINSIWSALGFVYELVTEGLLVVIQLLLFYHPQLQGSTVGDAFFFILLSFGAAVWLGIIVSRIVSR